MALSEFERAKLSPDEQNLIQTYKQGWQDNANDPRVQASYHTANEEIRRKSGFSGGASGAEYFPVDVFKAPDVPVIQDYQSQWEDEINMYMNQLRNPESYTSMYSDKIDNLLKLIEDGSEYVPKYQKYIDMGVSDMVNRHPFEYNPDTDPAYQRFLERVRGTAEQAYQDNLAGFANLSGGYISSWAESSAKQAQEVMNLQAQEAIESFEDLAYGKYKFENEDIYRRLNTVTSLENQSIDQFRASQSNKLNLLNALANQDEIAYGRFRDRISDTKDLANMVMTLDERDFERWKYISDQSFRKFEAEYETLKAEMDFKRNEWNKALERTELNGFVNNEDSYILGLSTGTPSKSARERVEAMEDYYIKQDKMLEIELKKQAFSYEQDKAIESMTQQFKMERLILSKNQDYALTEMGLQHKLNMDSMIASANGTTLSGVSNEQLSQGVANLKDKNIKKVNAYVEHIKSKLSADNLYDMDYHKRNAYIFNVVESAKADLVEKAKSGYWGEDSVYIASQTADILNQLSEFKLATEENYKIDASLKAANEANYRFMNVSRVFNPKNSLDIVYAQTEAENRAKQNANAYTEPIFIETPARAKKFVNTNASKQVKSNSKDLKKNNTPQQDFRWMRINNKKR